MGLYIKDHCQRKDIDLKIDSSYIGMESARTYQSGSTRKLSFRVQTGSTGLETGEENNLENGLGTEDSLANQKEGGNLEDIQAQMGLKNNIVRIERVDPEEEFHNLLDIRQQCVVYLWSILFGSDRAGKMAEKLGMKQSQEYSYSSSVNWRANLTQTILQPRAMKTATITATQETFFTETEKTAFSAKGVVKTADGREISFNLDVGMSRSFQQYTKQEASMVTMCDPLVINLNGNVANVSDQKLYFDLDADGEEEQIARLCEDSGYLALDFNQDGKINDGSELFGTKSGNGFADLAKYDEDQNGWIDENDEIWDKLKIWVQEENGNSRLYRLAEKGVGAICLQNASTDFTHRDSQGEVSAAVRSTGIFLYENGSAGTIQHLDLAVNKLAQYA